MPKPADPAPQTASESAATPRPGALGGLTAAASTAGASRAPLSREFQAAALSLAQVEAGQRLPDAVDAAARQFGLQGASRAALQDFAFTAVRRLAWCKAIAARLNKRPPAAPLAALQYVVLAQLAPAGDASTTPRSGDRAPRAEAIVVDQAVHAARAVGGDPAAAFLNATLRRFQRERDLLDQAVQPQLEARWNYPRWWLETLQQDHPAGWQRIAGAGNRQAPLILRVNRRRATAQQLVQRLSDGGWAADVLADHTVRMGRSTDVSRLPGFDEGWFSVQDAGAQLAAPWLDPQPGQRILDACAAPGGKTAHLLELVDADLLALDVDADRLRRVDDNLRRLGLNASLRAADAAFPPTWWDGVPFDRILLDAPCSASGIVGRHPDIRWLRRRSDIATLCRQQEQMLAALWPLLKPGGKLLYAVCSVFRAEGEGVVGSFLAAFPQARPLPLGEPSGPPPQAESGRATGKTGRGSSGAGLSLLPGVANRSVPTFAARNVGSSPAAAAQGNWDHDGFYYCLLQKPP